MNAEAKQRCGYAVIVGRPNVGKSTLVNTILGQKLLAVTAKPQTTRNRILAVHTADKAQVIFLDTPGLHAPQGELGRYMVEAAQGAIAEADVIVWMIDASDKRRREGLTPAESKVAETISDAKTPIIALINKVDLVKDKQRLLPVLAAVAAVDGVEEVVPVSARTGDGVEDFLRLLTEALPEMPHLYPADMLSEQAERFFVAELVREALMDLTHQEVPYSAAVVIDRFVEETTRCTVHATIHLERKSQRGIVIGKQGGMIEQIRTRAKAAAEEMIGCPVDLRLHVDVSPGWTNTPKRLKEMGYE